MTAELKFMDDQRVELGVARLTILDGGRHEPRAARIAQLTFDYVRELLEREMQHFGADLTLSQLDVPPIHVSLDTMDDEAIAQVSAEAIHRALLAAI